MAIVFFTYITKTGEYRRCCFGGGTIEESFDILTDIVKKGDQLVYAELKDGFHSPVALPVKAFDGSLIKEPIETLQQEWKRILI